MILPSVTLEPAVHQRGHAAQTKNCSRCMRVKQDLKDWSYRGWTITSQMAEEGTARPPRGGRARNILHGRPNVPRRPRVRASRADRGKGFTMRTMGSHFQRDKRNTLQAHLDNDHHRVLFHFNPLNFILDNQSKIIPFYIITVYFKAFLVCLKSVGWAT